MLTPLALFVTLLLVTAFIAHWSDNLGKKLGKKRVSVLRFRPRTSATILTVASSWGIMIFTLFALLIVVAPLRTALFRYDAERARFALEKQKSLERLHISEQRREQAETAATGAQTRAIRYGNEAYKSRGDAQKAALETQKAQSEFQSARAAESAARQKAQAAQSRQQRALKDLRAAQSKLGTSQNQLSQTQSDLAVRKAEVKQAQAEVVRAKADVTRTQNNLGKARSDLDRANSDLSAKQVQIKKAGDLLFAVGRQKIALEKVNDDLEKENSELATSNKRLKEYNASFEKSAAATIDGILSDFAFRDIQVPVDQTLAERRIDSGQNSMQVEKELRTLIIAARQATKKLLPGAKLTVGVTVADSDSKEPIQLDEVQTVQLYGRLLATANQPVSARVVSIANYPANTPEVTARFVLWPIRTIYVARQNIATGTIDTSKSESAIFGQLQKLVDEARYNAVKNDASPPLSPDDKNFFDGDTGQKLFETLHQVQKINHPVEVRIVAARDLDSAEPLQIRFVVGD